MFQAVIASACTSLYRGPQRAPFDWRFGERVSGAGGTIELIDTRVRWVRANLAITGGAADWPADTFSQFVYPQGGSGQELWGHSEVCDG